MDDNKELVKKDLALVMKINAKVHYDNKSEVKQIYDLILKKKLFKTSIGTVYTKRLEQIVSGRNQQKTCILCANGMDNQTVICKACLKKYQNFQKPREKGAEAEKKDTGYQQQISEISRQAAKTIKGGLDSFTSRVNEMADESDAAKQLKEKSKKISEQIQTEFGKAKEGSGQQLSDGQSGKSDKRKWLIAGIIIAAGCFILKAIGLGKIFTLLALAAIGWVVYKCIKKEKKRNAVIVAFVLLLLAGVFSDSGGIGNSKDLSNLLGRTQKQAEKQYGKPEGTANTGITTYIYDNGDWTYGISGDGKIVNVTLEDGNKTLAGISIGDNEETVERIMKKQGAKEENSPDPDRLRKFTVKSYHINVYFVDSSFHTVEQVHVSKY